MSIYIYGFQSLGDEGLREFDETVDDDDDGSDEHLAVVFDIDEWLTRILSDETDVC